MPKQSPPPQTPPPDGEDLQRFLEALPTVRISETYTRLDRYRDFNRVFSSDEGRRVFSQIVDLLEGPPVRESELSNHALLAARSWSRRLAHLITSWTLVAPASDPQGETRNA